MNMPTTKTRTTHPKDPGYLVPIGDLAKRCGWAGYFQGACYPDKALPILESYGLSRGEVKRDWAGNPVVTSKVAARIVNAYEKARVEEAKQREAAAALEREKRETMFAGGYMILEDARGPLMTGLTYKEFRAEESRRGNYPPPVFGDAPSYDSPEAAQAARQAELDRMNEASKAAGRAAAGPPRNLGRNKR